MLASSNQPKHIKKSRTGKVNLLEKAQGRKTQTNLTGSA
jgi:hypothetical protein